MCVSDSSGRPLISCADRHRCASKSRSGAAPLFRSWLVREHGDVLEEVAVAIVKEHGRRRHPGEDNALVSG